jgi:hypothetical protein
MDEGLDLDAKVSAVLDANDNFCRALQSQKSFAELSPQPLSEQLQTSETVNYCT